MNEPNPANDAPANQRVRSERRVTGTLGHRSCVFRGTAYFEELPVMCNYIPFGLSDDLWV